jgi:ElaB/YqjD/DUF883 family membrane-anchored ribosome-binding protein
METTTIVVLSVLSTLVIIGLIAMVTGLRKAQKEITNLLEDQRINEATHEAIRHRIDEECHEIRRNIKQDFDEINQQIEKLIDGVSEQIAQTNRNVDQLENNIHRRIDETHQQADERYVNISNHTEEVMRQNISDLDRRFDRLYQMLYEAFPQLKK